MSERIREIPYNYTSFSDREIVIRFLGEPIWVVFNELRAERNTGISARMMLEVLGDMWVVTRNPYLQEDMLEDTGCRRALVEAMRHRLRQIELRANSNTKALELHAAAGEAVDRFASQFEADRMLRDQLRRRFRRVTRKDNVDSGGLATASPGHDLDAAPQTRVQHRCVDLPEVRRRSQSDCLYRGSGGHRQDTSALTGRGRIVAASRIAACYAGLTHFGLVCVAPCFHTSLHGTATEG